MSGCALEEKTYCFFTGEEISEGDLVQYKSGTEVFNQGYFRGQSKNHTYCWAIERTDEMSGSSQNSWWSFRKDGKLELIKKTNLSVSPDKKSFMQNLISSFNNLFLTEPQKSFQKAGVTDTTGMLTPDGTKVFLNWLLQTNGAAFKTAVVDPINAEADAEKK